MADVSDTGSQSGDEAVDPACPKRGEPHYLFKLMQYMIQGHGTPAVAPCLMTSEESLQSSPGGASEQLTPSDERKRSSTFEELLGQWSRTAESYKTLSEVNSEIDRNFEALFQHFGVKWYGRNKAVETDQGSSQAAGSSPQALLDRPDMELEIRQHGVSDPTHDLELQVAGGSNREESSPQDEPREDIGKIQGQVSEPSGSSETTFAGSEVIGEEL